MLPRFKEWSWRWDLNPQPADYKSAALPIELRQPILRSTATPFSIRLQMPHCVGNDIYYTLFPGIVNTFLCLFFVFNYAVVTAQGPDMMARIYRSGDAGAAAVAAWRPPLQCLTRQYGGAL